MTPVSLTINSKIRNLIDHSLSCNYQEYRSKKFIHKIPGYSTDR